MRNSGTRFECLRLRPHDHIGWVFDGPEEFAELARPFLAEGAAEGELLMYVADEPDSRALTGLRDVVDPHALHVASIADVYGPTGIVDAHHQRTVFESALADALAAGYTGIRVAADNTPLVADEQRLSAWMRWELIADRFMSENAVTGLCAFDRHKVNVDTLRHLATLHPLFPAARPKPQFRLFSDAGNLCIEGEIDSSAISQLWLALDVLPSKTGILVDLATATLTSNTVVDSLARIANSGVSVTIRGVADAIRRLQIPAELPSERFALQVA